MSFLDEEWMKGHIAGVGQQGALEYETILGGGVGIGLSIGQKQHLSIARAKLRNRVDSW